MEVICRVLCADGVEQILCGVISGTKSLLVGCMYRPPKRCGSGLWRFQFPEISWTWDDENASGENEMRFLEGLDESFMIQCVDFPIFMYGKNGDSSLLDLLLTSEPERVLKVNALPPLGEAVKAHVFLEWKYAMKDLSTRFSKKKRKNVRKVDFDQINTGMGSVDWKKEFVGRNVNECHASFLNEYLRIYEKHVPEKRENL
ncbi:RNA-directed DNA polymerase from mobile element jockey-like [Brachionus plicatilis]|uniref:RNA-directed DNA polymerase from mobile element jockey-like n=1 Tax=Brachionus plicatilis TaxID=10195 RepID=A0A3M7S601_BRAPC|nr:RNA-directed DNA polymerase from mobile element jockey-like [Brachionus plicatilis]